MRMNASRLAVAIGLLLGWPGIGRSCGLTTPFSAPPPKLFITNGNVFVQLGTVFATTTPHSCACGLGVINPPSGLDFDTATIGRLNTQTLVFNAVLTSTGSPFVLTRNPVADIPWSTGVAADGSRACPGLTWYGFSNTAVPPVTPPTLGTNEIFAIGFHITGGVFLPNQFGQLGSGVGFPNGLPDFSNNEGHGARYSACVPEPSSRLSLGIGLAGIVALASWLRMAAGSVPAA